MFRRGEVCAVQRRTGPSERSSRTKHSNEEGTVKRVARASRSRPRDALELGKEEEIQKIAHAAATGRLRGILTVNGNDVLRFNFAGVVNPPCHIP